MCAAASLEPWSVSGYPSTNSRRQFMNTSRSILFALTALCLSNCAGPDADSTAYPIKLFRPHKAGDVYDLHAELDYTWSTVIHSEKPDKTVENSRIYADILGRCDIKEVDQLGREKTFSI